MIPRSFFERDPVTCARELIGCELVWNECAGIVVETEAYSVVNDEACHTFFRPSARKFVADHAPGQAYVYFNYGMYWLLNVLVKGGPEDGFVLIRALEPTRGISLMRKRRSSGRASQRTSQMETLCSGPGKLTIALGVDGCDHGRDLCGSRAFGFKSAGNTAVLASTSRIGISRATDLPWRFSVPGSCFISHRHHGRKSET